MEQNIDTVYELALKLGLENASDIEKLLFRNELIHLVALSTGQIRNEVANYFADKNTEIVNLKN